MTSWTWGNILDIVVGYWLILLCWWSVMAVRKRPEPHHRVTAADDHVEVEFEESLPPLRVVLPVFGPPILLLLVWLLLRAPGGE